MRRFAFAFLAVTAVTTFEVATRNDKANAQDGTESSELDPLVPQKRSLPKPTPAFRLRNTEADRVGFVVVEPAKADSRQTVRTETDIRALKKDFLQLMEAKAELMTPAELEEATKRARLDASELKAQRELDQVERLLDEIMDKHPNTKAAQIAGRAKEVLDPKFFWPETDPLNEHDDQPNVDPFGDKSTEPF